MPNWVKNNLRIKANGEKVLEVLEMIKDENGEMTFEKFMPCPEELETEPSPQRNKYKAEKFKEKYGAEDWYYWKIEHWGCKWDACESGFWKDGDDWIVSFQTPWGPPLQFLDELSKKFPNIEFIIQYADESEKNSPLGQTTFHNGLVSDLDMDGDEDFGQAVWDEEWVTNWKGEE